MDKKRWAVGERGALTVALDTRITPELEAEGMARDLVRHIQRERRMLGLALADRIRALCVTVKDAVLAAIEKHREHIEQETGSRLTVALFVGSEDLPPIFQGDKKLVNLGGHTVVLSVAAEKG